MTNKEIARSTKTKDYSPIDCLDDDLAEAVKSKTGFRLGNNISQSDSNGGDVVLFTPSDDFETWRLPALIDSDIKQRAAVAFRDLRDELAPPSMDTLKDWILTLGTLCSMRGDMAKNAQVVTAVYAAQLLALKLPSQCFTNQTLSDATENFKWFPAFSELRVFMESVADPMRKILERLKMVRDADERDLRGTFEYHTREERAAFWSNQRKRRVEAANKRFGVRPGAYDGMSQADILKAEYRKAGIEWPSDNSASWTKLAMAGMKEI